MLSIHIISEVICPNSSMAAAQLYRCLEKFRLPTHCRCIVLFWLAPEASFLSVSMSDEISRFREGNKPNEFATQCIACSAVFGWNFLFRREVSNRWCTRIYYVPSVELFCFHRRLLPSKRRPYSTSTHFLSHSATFLFFFLASLSLWTRRSFPRGQNQ